MAQGLVNNCLKLVYNPCIQDEIIKLLDIIIDAKWETFDEVEKFQVQRAIRECTKVSFNDPLLLQIFLKTLPGGVFNGTDRNAEYIIEMLVQTLKTSSYDCDLTYFVARSLVQLCAKELEYMVYFAHFAVVLDLSISGLVNQAAVEPKLFPAMKELMHLASLFYKKEYKDFQWVERYRKTNLMPDQFGIPKFFEFH